MVYRDLTVYVFIVCGYKELRFIRDSGMVIGGLFGIVQMIIWIYFQAWWVLPVIGFIVGAITNWLALFMIFRPIYPINICGVRLHGRFLSRQDEVAHAYSVMVSQDVLTTHRIIQELFNGTHKDKVGAIVKRNIENTVDRSLKFVSPFISIAGGDALISRVKTQAANIISADMVEIMSAAEDYMDEAFELQETLEERIKGLSYPEFEGLLHPTFQQGL